MEETRKEMAKQVLADSAELIRSERIKNNTLSGDAALEVLKIEAIRELIQVVKESEGKCNRKARKRLCDVTEVFADYGSRAKGVAKYDILFLYGSAALKLSSRLGKNLTKHD